MKKIAILVIGANAPKILGRVLDHFDDPRFRFFLHVDAKIDISPYTRDVRNLDRITMIQPRLPVFWGGFSMIEAELALIKAALADPSVQRLALWSDDTAPLRGPDETYQALMDAPDRIATDVLPYVQNWYNQFYFADSRFTNPLKMDVQKRNFELVDWENIKRLQCLVERGKKPLENVYFSRQWWALGRASAEAILHYADEDEHLVESFRFSLFPDETFFPTLFRLCFPETKVPDVPMYADYDRWPVPWVFGKRNELPSVKLISDRLFVRKLSPDAINLVDVLAESWNTKDHKKPNAVPMRGAIKYARAMRDAGQVGEAQKILARERELNPRSYELFAAWADVGVTPFDWKEKLRRSRSLRETFPPEVEPRSLGTLVPELSTLTEHGEFRDAVVLINAYWARFIARADLFQAALGALIRIGQIDLTRRLLDEASDAVRGALPVRVADAVERRLDQAEANRTLVQRSGLRIVPLGQNSFPTVLITRWGLSALPRAADESSPFELGDFYKDAAADAVADDFAGLSDVTGYVEKPAWGGGKVLRHASNGVAFMAHRSAQMGPAEKQRFFAHLDQMIAHWRQIRSSGRRMFIYVHTDAGDLNRLVAVAREKLLGPEAWLIVIDQNAEPTPVPEDGNVTLLHAPPPKNYPWFDAIGSATPEGMEYEQRVLAPVIEIVKRMAIVTEDAAAMSGG